MENTVKEIDITSMDYDQFDTTLQGFIEIYTEISSNRAGEKFTHTEVRSYARCTLPIIKTFALPQSESNQIYFLVSCIAASGLPHYDRANCASRILRLIKDYQDELKKENLEGIF